MSVDNINIQNNNNTNNDNLSEYFLEFNEMFEFESKRRDEIQLKMKSVNEIFKKISLNLNKIHYLMQI